MTAVTSGDEDDPVSDDEFGGPVGDDPVRDQLIDAAARVFARKGYDGTRIQEIVREAGFTTGAVYGRFSGKDELLHQAVVTRATPQVQFYPSGTGKVADLVAAGAGYIEPGLATHEALLLETYVAARREPAVAEAVADADRRWKHSVAPLVEAAQLDGTVDDDLDPESVLFLVRILRLGLLLHRGSGLDGPDPDAWRALVARVVASFGASDTPSPEHPPTDLPGHHQTATSQPSEGDQ